MQASETDRTLNSAGTDKPSNDAFISYSRKDSAFVHRLVAAFERYTTPRGLAVAHKRLTIFVDRQDFRPESTRFASMPTWRIRQN